MQVSLDQILVILLTFLFILSIPFEKIGGAFLNKKQLFSIILFNSFFIPLSIGFTYILFHLLIREIGDIKTPRQFFFPLIAVGIFQFLSIKLKKELITNSKTSTADNFSSIEKSNLRSIEGIGVVVNLLILLMLICYPFWQSSLNNSMNNLDYISGIMPNNLVIDIDGGNFWLFLALPFLLALITRLLLNKIYGSAWHKSIFSTIVKIMLVAVILSLVFQISRSFTTLATLYSNDANNYYSYSYFSFPDYIFKIVASLTIFIFFRSISIFFYLKYLNKRTKNQSFQTGSFQLSIFAPIYVAALTYHGSYVPFNWILLVFSCLIPLHMASDWLINYLLQKSYYNNTPKQEI
jgi:hypothetical protein